MARSALLNVMTQAAMKAGRSLSRDFGEVQNLQVSLKGPGDFVTNADRKAEKVIRFELEKARPDFGFLMEESGEIKGRDPQNRWIVDPLDGTVNYLHGNPHFCVSVALEREKEIVAGVIYDVIKDELFVAEKGQGAYVNDRRMRVAARTDLHESIIASYIPHFGKPDHDRFLTGLSKVMRESAGVRSTGSTALDLAYVASGRLDGIWQEGPDPWDLAAGLILVREAGGFTSDFSGGREMFSKRQIVAGNEAVHKSLKSLVAAL